MNESDEKTIFLTRKTFGLFQPPAAGDFFELNGIEKVLEVGILSFIYFFK